jgi:hypothetical protein
MLSEFSTVAGDLAGHLEDIAGGARLSGAPRILAQLETATRELLLQVGDISIEALRQQAEADNENDRTVGS